MQWNEATPFKFDKVNGNWDNNMIRISQRKESRCRINTSVRRNKSIQKSRTVRVTVSDPSKKVSHLNKVIWERTTKLTITKNYNKAHQVYQIPQNKLARMMDVQVSKGKHISRTVDRDEVSDEIASKTVHKDEEDEERGERSKTLSEAKPVKNCRFF